MILRRFRLHVLVRVVLLAATLAATCVSAVIGNWIAFGVVAVVSAYQVRLLVTYVEKTNRDLARLLDAIRYSDFSQGFTSGGRGSRYLELTNAMSAVMDDFRAARAEKEEGYRFLETVMRHIGTGLISFDSSGKVKLINTAAKRLLRINSLGDIKSLDSVSPTLRAKVQEIEFGEKDVLTLEAGGDKLQLSIYATGFKAKNELYKVVSLQDIGGELDAAEALAWSKLTRVLTHEIVNSVAPISSLASTASTLLEEVPADGGGAVETMTDVRGAVGTIARRSQGLLRFVNEYRKLTRVPTPVMGVFPVSDLFDVVLGLFKSDAEASGISIITSIQPGTLELTADRDLTEQALINVVKNGIRAVSGRVGAEVRLEAHIDDRSRAVIEVIDNGVGIIEEAMDQLFVPFFTTHKDGSGIGLALVREIMRQHGGTVSASSVPGERTVFRLRF